jgi:hypothetical protein
VGRRHDDPGTVVVSVVGAVAGDDLRHACEALTALLTGTDACLVVCEVSARAAPDAATADAVARLALTARRNGRPVQLGHASRDLRRLLRFMGIAEAVGLPPTPGPSP